MSKFVLISARSGADVLASEYRDFLTSSGLQPDRLDHVVLDSVDAELGDLSRYRGIFIGGSPFNVLDPDYSPAQTHIHRLLLEVAQLPQPKLFVCFGSSLLAQAYGGKVSHAHGEEAGPTTIELIPDAANDPLLRQVKSEFEALTGHTESVDKLPSGAVLLASGPTCPVQMYRLGESTWACQFHAEMDPQGMESRMGFYRDKGYFDPAEFDAIVSRIRGMDTSQPRQIMRNFVALCS